MKGFGLLSVIVSLFPAVHMAKVFVYGTLKKDQPNHFRMKNHDNGQAEFVSHARTVDRYPLVIATKYNIPFLLNVSGTGQRVTGEIYSVDQKMLEFLDEFEKCPSMYQRSLIRLEVQDGPGGGEHTLKAGSVDGPGGGEHTLKAGSVDGPGGGEHTLKAGSTDGPGGGEHTPKAGSVDGPGGGEHTLKAESTDGPGGGEHTLKAGSTDGPGGGEHTLKAGSVDGPGGGEHTLKAGSTDGPGGGEHTLKAGSVDGPGGGEHTLKAGSSIEAFVYSTATYDPEWLQKPTHESYEAYGDHGLHFVRREDRVPE